MRIVIASQRDWNRTLPAQIAESIGAETFLIDKKNALTKKRLDFLVPDYVFFPHWSHMISSEIYLNYECILFHMTDLPYGRGGSPLQNLILAGKTQTMISAIKVTKEVDAGDVYIKHPLNLSGSAQEIYTRASALISEMIFEILTTKPTATPQIGKVIKFRRRTPAQSKLPKLTSLNQLNDFVRMLDADGYPHAFTTLGDFRLEFTKAIYKSGKLKCTVEFEYKPNDSVE